MGLKVGSIVGCLVDSWRSSCQPSTTSLSLDGGQSGRGSSFGEGRLIVRAASSCPSQAAALTACIETKEEEEKERKGLK